MRNHLTKPAFARLLWIAPIFALTVSASAQGVPSTMRLTEVRLEFVPVREALNWLFRQAKAVEPLATYSIKEDVVGTVTLSKKSVPFKAALDAIVKQVKATYTVTNGVYEIRPLDPFGTRSPMSELKQAQAEIAASYGDLARRVLQQPAGGAVKPLSPDFQLIPLPKGKSLQDARAELLKVTKELRSPKVVSAAFKSVTDDGMSVVVTASYARPKLPPLMFRDVWSFVGGGKGWTLVERHPYVQPD